MYAVVDISDWKIVSIPSLGYMEKLWLRAPDGVLWLLKYPGTQYPSDAVNEKICSELAQYFTIPFQKVELCKDDENRLGCICQSIIPEGSTLLHGGTLLSNKLGILKSSPDYEKLDQKYTYQLIASVIPNDMEIFLQSVLFDNLVGNVDRHDKNWAVLRMNGTQVLSPCYDYGLSFFPTKETESTWFQNIGFERDGVVMFNTLFADLCDKHRHSVASFMNRLATDEFIDFVSHVFLEIPVSFNQFITTQYNFIQIRMNKMLKIWRRFDEQSSVSHTPGLKSTLFSGEANKLR